MKVLKKQKELKELKYNQSVWFFYGYIKQHIKMKGRLYAKDWNEAIEETNKYFQEKEKEND